jgi:hypothetical protein
MPDSAALLAAMSPRAEAWFWWLGTVLVLGLVFFLTVGVLRRRLCRPMMHAPTDTSDAWAEAGRRLRVPPHDAPDDAPPSASPDDAPDEDAP